MVRSLIPAWMAQRFGTKKCHDDACLRGEFHTAHLTAFGHWLYT